MNSSKGFLVAVGLFPASVVVSFPSAAHHSYAMFDTQKTITVSGTVTEFQWTNPHLYIKVLVRDHTTGKDAEWNIEGGGPNSLSREGWSRTSAKPGDKASVDIHPLRDGSSGGSLVSLTINGERVGKPRAGGG